ncbi:MAG TPA: GNAT family N-acetyltransferase [Alphaproteobacteria bacterium]|nr:GNAT family N-acetyltransferase [Alphaproteobacteria bacterium]
MNDLLDDPVWHALAAAPDHLVIRMPRAARFIPDVAPFFGVEAHDLEVYAQLAPLLGGSSEARLFTAEAIEVPPGWREVSRRPIRQMVLPADVALSAVARSLERLGAADVRDMLALAARADPGPFGPRTIELGCFLGIRDGSRLVAMAGERFTFPGFSEISAVATDPDYRGRGFARDLTLALASRFRAAGRTPFLHVFPDNRAAAKLYESLGFVDRRELQVVWLAPA